MSRPDTARALERFLARLDGADACPPVPDHAQSWASLSNRLRAEGGSVPARARGAAHETARAGHHPHFVLPPGDPSRPWWRRGAVIAVAAAVFGFAALRAELPHAAAEAPPPRTFTTAVAQRAEIRLTDGTQVSLAPASRLRVATDFGTERRDIYLEGQAYFDVVHDEQRPFTVYAGNASAHDVGTSFLVRSYAEDGAVQVVVREGLVAMSGVGRLAAGDVGRLTSDGETSLRRGVDVDAMLGWMSGRLVFEDAPLGSVLAEIRRWKGIEVELRDSSLAALPFTGSIDDLRTSSAVDLVAATLGLRVARDGERYVLAARAGRTPTRFNPGRRHHVNK